MRRLAAILVLASLAVAGCIQAPDDPTTTPPRESRSGGTMTASEADKEDVGLCTEGLNVGGSDGRFCATRTITVDGTVSGFSLLDVDLQTFNGDVVLTDAPGTSWGFVATLKARGDTADQATSRVNDIAFRWAHEDGSGHFVEVVAEHEGSSDSRSATLELRMPRSLALVVVAATSNGDVTVSNVLSSGLALATSNGDIVAKADVAQVSLTTSNGEIDAQLAPIDDGRWMLATSNGDITLKVPEGAAYGYDMEGTTSNGEVDYTLRDGDEGPCPQGSQYYTPPCSHRTFVTRGMSGREKQAHATLATSNGEIDVGPA